MADRSLPPRRVRALGKLQTVVIAAAPRLWPSMKRATEARWNRMAPGWDERMADPSQRVAPLQAGCEHVGAVPRDVLEIGTGTGTGALMLKRRFPDARVIGADLSEEMVRLAREKAGDAVEFVVADASSLPFDADSFDLVSQLNVPPFLDEVARVLRPGGHLIVADSLGSKTPYHTPRPLLRRGLRRNGLDVVFEGAAGSGVFLVARARG